MLGIFLDTETNGLKIMVHHIIEIAIIILDLNSGKFLDRYTSFISLDEKQWSQGSPYSLQFNGISKEECFSGPPLQEVQNNIKHLFMKWNLKRKKAAFICQNPSFDRMFFTKIIDVDYQEQHEWPYHWLDLASMHFTKSILSGEKMETISLSKNHIAKHYGLREEQTPHRALNGVHHMINCYEEIIGFPNRVFIK